MHHSSRILSFRLNHEVFGLMQARIQQTQNSVGPLFLVDDYGVCTQNKTIALQLRIISALVDMRQRLWESLSAASTTAGSSVSTWDDVLLPCTACSEQLIAYDKTWSSWVHCAVEYPGFWEECTTFIIAVDRGLALENADPQWLLYPDRYNWARSVSVSSAMSVIWISRN